MARPKNTDFLSNFRFLVTVQLGSGVNPLAPASLPSAGFNTATVPEVTQAAVEYREGHFMYTQKYPGIPSMNDITLTRGVALSDGTMWAWLRDVIEGNSEYRANLTIQHFHRDAKPSTNSDRGTVNSTDPGVVTLDPAGRGAYLEYRVSQACPTRHKVSTDLDATGAEISIQDLDLAYESFDIVPFADQTT